MTLTPRHIGAPVSQYRWSRVLGAGTASMSVDGALVTGDGVEHDITISRGRSDATGEAEPQNVQARFIGLESSPLRVGAPVSVAVDPAALTALGLSAAHAVRSAGATVTDLQRTVTATDARTELTATGVLSRYGRIVIGDEPWPQESETQRAARIASYVGEGFATRGGNTVDLIDPRDVDARDARELLDDLAHDTGAHLFETRTGQVVYLTQLGRSTRTPSATVNAYHVQGGDTWSQSTAGLVNDLTITKETEAGGAWPIARLIDAASIAELGAVYAAKRAAGQISKDVDARRIGERILRRWSLPEWTGDALTIDLLALIEDGDLDTVDDLLALDLGELIEVTGLPATVPLSDSLLWVEGITERITHRQWLLELSVVPYILLGDGISWLDVPVGVTWGDAAADLSWRAVATRDASELTT